MAWTRAGGKAVQLVCRWAFVMAARWVVSMVVKLAALRRKHRETRPTLTTHPRLGMP